MKRLFRAFARDAAGATTIEYGMIAVLLALGGAIALEHKGDVLQERYESVVAHFERVWGVEGRPATFVAEPAEFDVRRLPDLAPAGGADER
jgi:Flp pilus assembly pilin Flp